MHYNYIPSITATTIASRYFNNNLGKYSTMDLNIMSYGLKRYLIMKNDYRKCLNIIYNNVYMGHNIYGINNACEYYHQKNIKDISDEELISLVIFSNSPTKYEINSEENKNKTLEILNDYNK